FAATAFNRFDYNDRSELKESSRYIGNNIYDITQPVHSEYRHFEYDPIGNRSGITEASNNGSYISNNLNQYTTETPPGGGSNTYVHDEDGNLTSISGNKNVTYTYNAENRLISAGPTTPITGDKKIELLYDYKGRRVQKVVSSWNGAWTVDTTKHFVYDGWNVIQEITTAQPTKYYVWGLDLSQSLQGAGGVGGLLSIVEGTSSWNYLYDGNGNVGQMLNSSTGAIEAHYEYDPYGNETLSTGALASSNPYRFSTKYLDDEFNLYYYGYRYYDPETGRWLSRDPIREEGFLTLTSSAYYDVADLNLYAFVLNNSINYFDEYGLAAEIAWDLFNVGTGILSLACNISSGNVIGAVIDVGGLAIDITATAVPFVPGGASAGIKSIRLAKATRGLAKAMQAQARAAKNSSKLVRFVLTKWDEAHHIVAITAKKAEFARKKLKQLGIDINDVSNGVSLPKGSHRHIHTDEYYKIINKAAENWNTKQEALQGLNKIADDLLRQTGKLK
ncbi:MAG: AHH domain-containing protein, partial [Candidatus Omnitrophica bacterium]|nr:AHH domain-containing protein [Candidatus Omnitrophota bacterium]